MADVLPEEGTTILITNHRDETRWIVRHVGPEVILLIGQAHVDYVAAGRHKVSNLDSATQVRTIGRWIWEDSYSWVEAP